MSEEFLSLFKSAVIDVIKFIGGWFANDGWFYRYQTLISALIALAGAYFTVRQMQASDRLTDRRHRHAVRSSTRRDKIKLEQALVLTYSQLVKDLTRLRTIKMECVTNDAVLTEKSTQREIKDICRRTITNLQNEGFVNSKELFDGHAKAFHDMTISAANSLTQIIENIQSKPTPGNTSDEEAKIKDNQLKITSGLENLSKHLNYFIGSVDAIMEEYEINVFSKAVRQHFNP